MGFYCISTIAKKIQEFTLGIVLLVCNSLLNTPLFANPVYREGFPDMVRDFRLSESGALRGGRILVCSGLRLRR